MSQKCSCDSSYVYDLRTESCKKICRGSNESFVKHDSFDHQYQIYKNRYTNCSYVDGNLELTNLEGSYDLGFLKDIEEVDGYVLILNVFSNYLNLTNLRIIRGKELFHHREEDYSLYVALNHNPYNDTQGLLELQFNSLSEVVRGKVHFLNNNLLCFANTIRWDDINPSTRPAFSIVFNSKNYKRQLNYIKEACKNFYNEGQCHPFCPMMRKYDQSLMKWVENPDGRYSFGSLCCTLLKTMMQCPGLDDSSFLNSKNIEDFRGCTIVDGSLSILGVSFLRDVHLGTVPLKLEDLNVLKDVRTINGYLSIQELPNEAESISFLSGLEIINGRFLTGLDMSEIYLTEKQKSRMLFNKPQEECDAEGKTCHSECSKHGCWGPGPDKCLKCKNKRVETTNQCVAKCTDVPMLYEAENNTCRACHEQCAEGCSGPGDDQCFQCLKVKVLGLNNTAVCMTECPVPLEPPFLYPDEQKICRQCDMACADGNGTTESEVLCLNKSQVYCPDGYFEKQYRSKVPNHPLNKKQVCQPCDPMCLTCSTEGVANCPDCRYYRYENLRKYSTCVESCPKFHYPEQKDCSPCHNECLNSCTGPTSMDCDNCRKFKIITSVENGTFKCVEECPASLPFLVDDTDPDKPTMTVEERKKILSIAIPTVGGVLLLGLLLTLFGYYWRQRERAKENTMKLTTKMMGVDDTVGDELKKIPSEEVLDKPDDSRIVEGDKLMRLPSYSYDKDDLARHLSVGDAGTEEMMGAGASNRPIREKRYGHLESAAVAKQQRDLSPNNRLRVDSFNNEPDGRVGILKHPPSPPPPPAPLGNGNIPGYSPGYGPYIHGPESIPSQRLNLPLDEDDYLQPKSVNPKAYLDLENNKEYYLNEKQMSQASRQQPYTDPSDNYLVPNSVPTIFENPDYFEGDPRDSVFDRKTPPRHNSDSSWKSVNE
ncbi:EGFR-like protein [Mya arenaria]|uniref:EGFR-like protein n=1 Tax=Mya arenaria TaxID=6604 RepID=A0ABY7ES60_MYAAR|nr:EGFR-like protein [Mya arenaria]